MKNISRRNFIKTVTGVPAAAIVVCNFFTGEKPRSLEDIERDKIINMALKQIGPPVQVLTQDTEGLRIVDYDPEEHKKIFDEWDKHKLSRPLYVKKA